MPDAPIRYRSPDEDSGRWAHLTFRPDDIVITTRSKSGTTWMQMLCALLVFRRADLPRPLAELSPWLDWLVTPIDEVVASLDDQTHRRFIKTHTPLDGIPIRDDVTYITVARHPLDMAVSLYHQGDNLDRERIAELIAEPAATPEADRSDDPPARPDRVEWLQGWIAWDGDPRRRLDSLPGVLHHLSLAWARRHEPNMVLIHFDDLLDDLIGEMHRLAVALDVGIDRNELIGLGGAATFERMKADSDMLAPDRQGVLKNRAAFFRRGNSGAGVEALSSADVWRYRRRAAELAAPDLLDWLHRHETGGSGGRRSSEVRPGQWPR